MLVSLNPFLPSLATAVLAGWPEAAARQLQKTDSLNPKAIYITCLVECAMFSYLGNK